MVTGQYRWMEGGMGKGLGMRKERGCQCDGMTAGLVLYMSPAIQSSAPETWRLGGEISL